VAVSVAAVLGLAAAGLLYTQTLEQELDRRGRTDALRNAVQKDVLKGQQAMGQGRPQDARVHLASARRLIASDPALADLVAPIDRLRAENDQRWQEQAARQAAVNQCRKFAKLRNQALFHGTLFTGVDLPPNLQASRRAAGAALDLFAANLD